MLPTYHIGTLDKDSSAILSGDATTTSDDENREVFLQAKTWSKAILCKKTSISPDTKIFSFKLNHESQKIGLPTGQHLMMRLRDPATREAIIRSYTPYSDGSDRGQLDILIKIYYDTPQRKGGVMTQALDSLPIGHWVDFKGPVGKFVYHGNGICTVNDRECRVRRFIMVCGGSGITPIRQVLRAVMQDPNDTTPCIVFNGNRSVQDILCKEELDSLEAANPSRCRIINALSDPPPIWSGIRGFVNQALIPEEMVFPKASGEGDELVLVCGPPPMVKAVEAAFVGLGFKSDDFVFF